MFVINNICIVYELINSPPPKKKLQIHELTVIGWGKWASIKRLHWIHIQLKLDPMRTWHTDYGVPGKTGTRHLVPERLYADLFTLFPGICFVLVQFNSCTFWLRLPSCYERCKGRQDSLISATSPLCPPPPLHNTHVPEPAALNII